MLGQVLWPEMLLKEVSYAVIDPGPFPVPRTVAARVNSVKHVMFGDSFEKILDIEDFDRYKNQRIRPALSKK